MSDKVKAFFKKASTNPMSQIQMVIERIILYSRYILVVFYVGLAVALGIYAITFIFEVMHVAELAFSPPKTGDGRSTW